MSEEDLNQEQCRVGEHQCFIKWPKNLTPDEFSDLEYWLVGVLRKARRASERPAPSPKEPPEKDHSHD